MNERIESLIELSEVWDTDGDVDKCEVDLYMFAELIVRECALVVHKKTGAKSALNVLEHFGVEL
jgi:hypothetical protein